MIAIIVILLEVFCCLGLGAATLRLLKIDGDLTIGEQWALSFAIGFGVLGWIVFPLGIAGFLSKLPLILMLAAGAAATLFLRKPVYSGILPHLNTVGKFLIFLLGLVVISNLLEGIAPPADADTLAYHFANPKQFINAGRIELIQRALSGTMPSLIHMTYIPALALGGELALTLWTIVSGWAAAGLLFVLCRQHLSTNWSLTVTLIFLTTPAIIYGIGSGQLETRITLFVMVGAWATARSIETGRSSYTILAGLASGFFAAAKFTGLLFAAVSGIAILIQRRWFLQGAVFGTALLAAGFQWYAWNAIHTGDPFFPILFQWLGRDDLTWWNKAHDLYFKDHYFIYEKALPHTLAGLALYPFKATLDWASFPNPMRVGLGPFGLLVLPFSALGLWRFRQRIRRSRLTTYALLTLFFYVFWFFAGGSQRIRHLVPVLPLFLIFMTVAAERLTLKGLYKAPLMMAIAGTLFIQVSGQGLFSLNYIKFLTRDSGKEEFLLRNVPGYSAVQWINANLKNTDKIYTTERQLIYYFAIPSFFASVLQGAVETDPKATTAHDLYVQLRKVGITHFLIRRHNGTSASVSYPTINILYQAGCLMRLKSIKSRFFGSRTLNTSKSNNVIFDVFALKDKSCLEPPPIK